MRPEILLLDEPAAGLDPRGRDSIFENIVQYQKESGNTVLIVSHSMEDMARYCDHLIVMNEGQILMEGQPSAIFSRAEELSQVGLDIPQITKLVMLLKEKGIDTTLDAVLSDMRKRDENDRTREVAPAVPADDAVMLDNSELTKEETIDAIIGIIDSKLK
jgi:energy-coupling factor transport system ATP-binding protein